jgi:hypothetical protein
MNAIPEPKPLVALACVCERVLVETDNVVSLIRVVDTFTLPLPLNRPMPGATLTSLIVVVALKSGDVVSEHDVGLRLRDPEGHDHPVQKWTMDFRGGEQGVNLAINLAIPNPKIGVHWFDVLWREEVLTRIPFRVQLTVSEREDDSTEPKATSTP